MLVENQLVKVKWHNRTKAWYEQKGYKFTHIGDTFVVRAEDVQPNSSIYVNVRCDHCGKVFLQQYYYYTKTQEKNGTECVQCKGKFNAIKSLKKRQSDFYNRALRICEQKGYKLVSKASDYINSSSIITYCCPKHGIKQCRWSHFIRGIGCNECGNEIISDKLRLSKSQLIEVIDKKGVSYLLNPDDYISNSIPNLRFRCAKCGDIFHTSLSSFSLNSGFCKKCGIEEATANHRLPIDAVRKIIESKNNNKWMNQDSYKTVNENSLIIKCGTCGNTFSMSLGNYRKNWFSGKCRKCSEKSVGEKRITQILDYYKINYSKQEHFDGDLHDIKPIPLDFYLPDYNLAIEFDGLQHYKPTFGEESFKKTLLHDGMKNNYCRWNNIDLLRIPYWERDNIEEILSDKLNIIPSVSIETKHHTIKYIPTKYRT